MTREQFDKWAGENFALFVDAINKWARGHGMEWAGDLYLKCVELLHLYDESKGNISTWVYWRGRTMVNNKREKAKSFNKPERTYQLHNNMVLRDETEELVALELSLESLSEMDQKVAVLLASGYQIQEVGEMVGLKKGSLMSSRMRIAEAVNR